jgi:hypothetical protein
MKEQRIQPGINLLGFETTEEMMGYLREQEERAITRTHPEQWTITWGDYVVRVVDGLIIFGRIFTEEEYLTESEVLSPGEDPAEVLEEVRYEMERLRDSFRRGYRYGRYYSDSAARTRWGSKTALGPSWSGTITAPRASRRSWISSPRPRRSSAPATTRTPHERRGEGHGRCPGRGRRLPGVPRLVAGLSPRTER